MLDDKYEVLDYNKELLERMNKLYKSLKDYAKEDDLKALKRIIREIDDNVDYMRDDCIEDMICPECGCDLESVSWEDDCGIHCIYRCQQCGKEC